MYIDHEACSVFWRAYLSRLPGEHRHHSMRPDAFGFGDEPALAEELARLVIDGKKRATTSLPVEFTSLGEPLPRAGDVSIIVTGNGSPAAVIERVRVTAVAFGAVEEEYAAIEGEGDGSLAYWRRAHAEFFGGLCERLGGHFDERTPVLCQVFRVVWTLGGGPDGGDGASPEGRTGDVARAYSRR